MTLAFGLGTVLPLLLGVLAAGGALFMLLGVLPEPPSDADVVEARLRAYGGEAPSLAELELQVPFARRIVLPAIHRAGRILDKMTPARVQQDIQQKITVAGRPLGLSAADFSAVRWVLTALLGLLGVALGVIVAGAVGAAIGATLGALVGLYAPLVWLNLRARSRRNELHSALPDAMDLLTVAVEAGLGFEAAMARVAEKSDNPLAIEFARVLQEARLGRPRLEALDDMGRRCGVEDLHNFVQAVIQSEQMGASIAKILQVQSDEIRRKRLSKAQEKGAQASLKMLLPMVGCIFPSIWVILLGPAAVIVTQVLFTR